MRKRWDCKFIGEYLSDFLCAHTLRSTLYASIRLYARRCTYADRDARASYIYIYIYRAQWPLLSDPKWEFAGRFVAACSWMLQYATKCWPKTLAIYRQIFPPPSVRPSRFRFFFFLTVTPGSILNARSAFQIENQVFTIICVYVCVKLFSLLYIYSWRYFF